MELVFHIMMSTISGDRRARASGVTGFTSATEASPPSTEPRRNSEDTAKKGAEPDVHELDAALRGPVRGRHGQAAGRLAPDRDRDRRGVHVRSRPRAVPRGGPEG